MNAAGWAHKNTIIKLCLGGRNNYNSVTLLSNSFHLESCLVYNIVIMFYYLETSIT